MDISSISTMVAAIGVTIGESKNGLINMIDP